MQQLSLSRDLPTAKSAPPPFDQASEELLMQFRTLRLESGANAHSVAREVSQLRAVAREAGPLGIPLPLPDLLVDLRAVSRALTEPRAAIARSTGRARLVAVQRFITVIGPTLGYDAQNHLRHLDALLPARPRTGWHEAGTIVAGGVTRRRRRGPSLSGLDLHTIVASVPADSENPRAVRDRALVALHCFSGLRPEEIAHLHWRDLIVRVERGQARMSATVERRGRVVHIPIIGPAQAALDTLARDARPLRENHTGFVFCGRTTRAEPLGYRMGRLIVTQACRAAGYRLLEASDLRAAYAHWLGVQGLSDHEVAAMLGIARVRTVDALRMRHAALDALRTVRERLG